MSAVLAYGASQLVIGAGGLIRIPLLVTALGATQYGRLTVLLAAWPWLASLSEAVRQAARVRVAEGGGDGGDFLRRSTGRAGAAFCLVGGALVGSPVVYGQIIGDEESAGVVWLSIWILAFAAGWSCLLGRAVGALEGLGHTGAVNLAYSLSTIVGLPVLVLALEFHPSLPVVVLASAVGFVAPFAWLVMVYRRRPETSGPRGAVGGRPGREGRASDVRLVGHMWIWSATALLGSGLDIIVVGVVLGGEGAATYSVAQRLMTFATLVPVALGGFTTAYFAKARSAGADGASLLRRLHRVTLLYALVSAVATLAFVAVAPAVEQVLGRGQISAPQSLYWALGLVALVGGLGSPLMASLTTPAGLRLRNVTVLSLSLANVIATIAVTPWMGLVGPAVSTVVANLLIAVVLYGSVRRRPSLLTSGVEPSNA